MILKSYDCVLMNKHACITWHISASL